MSYDPTINDMDTIGPPHREKNIKTSSLEQLSAAGKAVLAEGVKKGLTFFFQSIPYAVGNEIAAILPKPDPLSYSKGIAGLIQKVLVSPVLVPLNLINSTIVHVGSLLYDTSNTVDVYCFQALAKGLESYQNRLDPNTKQPLAVKEHNIIVSISSKTLQALFCAGPLVPLRVVLGAISLLGAGLVKIESSMNPELTEQITSARKNIGFKQDIRIDVFNPQSETAKNQKLRPLINQLIFKNDIINFWLDLPTSPQATLYRPSDFDIRGSEATKGSSISSLNDE